MSAENNNGITPDSEFAQELDANCKACLTGMNKNAWLQQLRMIRKRKNTVQTSPEETALTDLHDQCNTCHIKGPSLVRSIMNTSSDKWRE